LYEILLFFAFFSNFFCSEISNFRRPLWPPKIAVLFSAVVISGGDWLAAENNLLFSAARKPAAENKLFSAASHWPPKIKPYFRPGFFGGQKPPKISQLPPKIAYFRRQLAYFRRLLAAENDCSCCSVLRSESVLLLGAETPENMLLPAPSISHTIMFATVFFARSGFA
jgi:hypothetical protein